MLHHPAFSATFSALPLEAQLLELQYASAMPKLNLATPNTITLPPATFKSLNASSSKISNITNNTDVDSINSRIFVGNLNTFVITKDDVENIFRRYGKLIGISMHKGYAFIQYTLEQDARNAVRAEDQRVYATQPIDVNMASEPKPNRPSRKRPNGMISKNMCNLVDVTSFAAPPLKHGRSDLTGLSPILAPAVTKPSMTPRVLQPLSPAKQGHRQYVGSQQGGKLEDMAGGDILICGNCKKDFPDIDALSAHKSSGCKPVQSPCKCLQGLGVTKLVCATCREDFSTAWDLLKHCQTSHQQTIFINHFLESESSDKGISKSEQATAATTSPCQDADHTGNSSEDTYTANGQDKGPLSISYLDNNNAAAADTGSTGKASMENGYNLQTCDM